ncbi:MAG: cyclic pyranopterin monophosphate synthase MoaC [Rhodobacteraceae bacterium]|nr:cyclic pyranopterin monophosphate synthase MoaC [Paracoccaceae bacterium]
MAGRLTHFDADGAARMVDISDKDVTRRIAVARGSVTMAANTRTLIAQARTTKGDVLAVARLAGIMGAKKCADLIPLCHPLPITRVSVDLQMSDNGVEIESTVKTTGRTGAEMEALTAVTSAALTVYDMVKAVDKNIIISNVQLVFKDGGKSGRFEV